MKKSEISVLVVEDDSSIREPLCEAIRRFGYRVSSVSKPDDALSLLKIRSVQAAVVDVMLPRMSGIELVKQMRATAFGDAAVILSSGIFKDKNFIQDALSSTKALDYLVKPYNVKSIRTLLDKAFENLTQQKSLHMPSLLSKAFVGRDRIKAIENLDEMIGYDIPFLLSLLMTEQSTGNLNMTDEEGEIYGITIAQGCLVRMDTSTSQSVLTELLIEKGFITAQEIAELPKEKIKGDIIRCMIAEGFVSPHAVYPILHQQIFSCLESLVQDKKFKIAFSRDRFNDIGNFLSLQLCLPIFNKLITEKYDLDYLEGFYSEWLGFNIRKQPHFDLKNPILQFSTIKQNESLLKMIDSEEKLEDILEQATDRLSALKTIHMLSLSGLIVFDDVKRTSAALAHIEKIKDVAKRIEGKDAVQIFVYFGSPPEAKVADVERIYKEFVKNNHPDHVPPTADAETKNLVNKVFSIVSGAHDILVHEEKRKKYFNELKATEFSNQVKAESQANHAINLLQKNKIKDALDMITESVQLYQSALIVAVYAWAKLKSYPGVTPPKIIKEITENLEKIPHQERRIPIYQFVMGLLRKAQGDTDGAVQFFDRAILMDSNFQEAVKESQALKAHQKKSFDLLNGDITSLMSNIFKRK